MKLLILTSCILNAHEYIGILIKHAVHVKPLVT